MPDPSRHEPSDHPPTGSIETPNLWSGDRYTVRAIVREALWRAYGAGAGCQRPPRSFPVPCLDGDEERALHLTTGDAVNSHQWDARYGGDELVWTSTPNQFLVAEVVGLPAGRAVDLACGEGRNSIWLAEQGWEVTGVDFSPVGLAKAKRFADRWGVEVTWIESAIEDWTPSPDGYDLVAMLYLQLPQAARSAALSAAASAVAPGGTLVVIAHDVDNLTRGFGGPPNPDVLYRVSDVTDAAVEAGLTVERAEQATRVVDTDDGPREAIDTVVRALNPRQRVQ